MAVLVCIPTNSVRGFPFEEIIVEKFPKMGKEIITQVQETQRVPNRINPRRNTLRHILIKLTKIKHKEQNWDDPEGWNGKGGGKRVQDGEHMYTCGGLCKV